MGKKEEEQGAKLIRCGMGIVLGGVLALAVCFAFLLAASAAISGGLAGEELMYQLTIVGCVLGAFAGGPSARCALRMCPWRPEASACCAAACAAARPPGCWGAGRKKPHPGKNAENN